MDRTAKEKFVSEISETLANVSSIVLADYRGLDVPTVTAMRHEFTKAGCGYRVLKNTLLKVAIQGSPMEPMAKYLSGPTAVIWTTDAPAVAAKLAVRFAKEQQHFVIKGGYFEGEALEPAGVDQLAKMPDKPELQASLLMTFIAAPTDFVRTIIAGPQNFVYALDARKRSLEAA